MRRFECSHWIRRHFRRLPFRLNPQPIHPFRVAIEEQIGVYRQCSFHSIFPHWRGHAHQCAVAFQWRWHPLGRHLHHCFRHFGQSYRCIYRMHGLQNAHKFRPHDVWNDVRSRRRCHCHGDGRHAIALCRRLSGGECTDA